MTEGKEKPKQAGGRVGKEGPGGIILTWSQTDLALGWEVVTSVYRENHKRRR